MRQHDVQELNRILFSALETSLVGTSGHDLINRLYHGTVVNQIVCKECKNISEKQEDFLDLTVAVKNVSSLEDALWNMYVEEEVFDCDNLYHCGTCDRLVRATKSKLNDLDYVYDLFSVIIHKGGCYGGHYHVYIKDVDHLGNWQFQEPDKNLKALQNEKDVDDPLTVLKAVLLQEENNLTPVDQLGQKLLKKIGTSWNKKFKKQHGPLQKFLKLHSQTFLLSSDESMVTLQKKIFLQVESDFQSNEQQILQMLASKSPGLNDTTTCPHWFDINDSKVQPIKEEDIEQQFQGKESAYMLFYRKSQLQRPPEGDLQQSIFQLLEFWEGDMVLSVAKRVPAGLHLYQTFDGNELTLCEVGIVDGEDIFVWNGVEVGGVQIPTGVDCEPLLLHVLHLETSGDSKRREQLVESPHVFPANAEVGTVLTALSVTEGVILTRSAQSSGGESWTAIPQKDMQRTFREHGLRDGSSVLVQDSYSDVNSLLTQEGKWITGTNEIDWLEVKNLCQLESEEKQVKISAAINTVVFDIRIKAIKELKLMKELVPDNSTLKEAEVKLGSSLGLCLGKAPTSSQLFLFFTLETDVQHGTEMEVIVEETLSVRDDATLKELMICSGDTLLLTEGKFPPPGFLKVPIWWYQPQAPSGHREREDQPHGSSAQGVNWRAAPTQGVPGHMPAEVSLLFLGDIDISEDATLVDLKSQARALPPASELAVPGPALLRAWTVENKRPSRLLRADRRQLNPQDMLLRTQMRVPGQRAYTLAMDLVWDTTRGSSAGALRQRVANCYALPVEKIEIAKYFQEKFEWLPISSWNQQITKKKKKKKQDNLQGAPYYLKDGDTIGVKNLLVDDDDDFSTTRDDIGKEKQKQLALEKKHSRETLRANNDLFSNAGTPTRPRGPEASLSIRVGSFR
ncbi:Ubiquitin carboxyl-terminal hydrolase 40 [Fukomys damarensis]|uniref:ubiquitinyl hydrolase 1 n=1 Tax=Fukomys damarensis TaxID=885580 RepID=A0A091CU78_FUKDA|nr:Ubiquitin carboxyl-terminal hydrolase 40 [Fukomys damarensis]